MKTIPCPHCGKPINPASLLGKQNTGRHKNLTPEARAFRAEQLAAVRAKRWPKKGKT